MRKLILSLLLLICGYVQAQDRMVDSLLVELSKAKTDSARIMVNCNLSRHYTLSDAKVAKQYAQQAQQLANAAGFKLGKAKALVLLGNAQLIMGEYDKAMDSQYKALRISQQLQDTVTLISCYSNLGNVYNKTEDTTHAARFYHMALELAEKTHDQLRISNAYNNLGDIYEDQQQYKKALAFYKRALAILEKIDNKRSLAIALHNVGNIHLHIGDPAKGLPYLFRSVKINEEIHNDMIRMASLGKIAEIYLALGKNKTALAYAQQSLDMARKTSSNKKIAEAAQVMHNVYASLSDFKNAYAYLTLYTQHNDSVFAESRARITSELSVKYDADQKELENRHLKVEQEIQEKELKLQRYTLLLGALVVTLLLALLVVLYVGRKKQRSAYLKLEDAHTLLHTQQKEIIAQKNEISSQAVVLREQNERLGEHHVFKIKIFSIISHDLRGPFNSINGLLNLAQKKTFSEQEVKKLFGLLSRDLEVAQNMLDNVLVWAKAQLEGSSVHVQPVNLHQLAEETIDLVNAQAAKKSIAVLNQVTPHTLAMADKDRLSFVLRNLLMNAVKFSYPEGTISVQVETREGQVVLAVCDNGKGMSADDVAKLFSERRFTTFGTSGEKGTGLGLRLCKEFLESFEASMAVESEEGKGSAFLVTLPSNVVRAEPEQTPVLAGC